MSEPYIKITLGDKGSIQEGCVIANYKNASGIANDLESAVSACLRCMGEAYAFGEISKEEVEHFKHLT